MNLSRIKNQIINDLGTELPELQGPKDSFSIVQLNSRKNLVYELNFKHKPKNYPKTIVLKLFRTDFVEREYEILNKLKPQGLTVPNILYFKKPYLLLEKVEGENLSDYINYRLKSVKQLSELNEVVKNELKDSINCLAKWLSIFHNNNLIGKNDLNIIVLNKGDARLRDFIFQRSKKVVSGVDFEEAYEGNHIDDVAWICCSLLDTNPGIFEMAEPRHKIELINLFLTEYYNNNDYYFSFNYFASRLIEFLNLVITRRSLEIGPLRKQNILKKISRGL